MNASKFYCCLRGYSVFLAATSAFAKASRELLRGYFAIRFSVDAEPPHAAPHRSASFDRLEIVLLKVLGDFLAEHGSLHVRSAEMDAGPYSGIDYFLLNV